MSLFACLFALYFSFTKSENRRVEWVLPGGVSTSGRKERVGERCRRVKMVQKLCTHACKLKSEAY
jgi:hypothetical protein